MPIPLSTCGINWLLSVIDGRKMTDRRRQVSCYRRTMRSYLVEYSAAADGGDSDDGGIRSHNE